MGMISNVIQRLDTPSEDVTELRVVKLLHADSGEVADEMTSIFNPTSSSTDQNSRSMGFARFMPWAQPAAPANSQSDRMKRQTTVSVVADRRKQAVIISASKSMMESIVNAVKVLDEGTEGVQMVTAIPIDSADPSSVQTTLASLFPNSHAQTQTQTQTALAAREQGNVNSQSSSSTSSSSGIGSTGGTTGLH
jgi:hypothetical protein